MTLLRTGPEGVERLLELRLGASQLHRQVLGPIDEYAAKLLDDVGMLLELCLVDGSLTELGEASDHAQPAQALHDGLFVADDE